MTNDGGSSASTVHVDEEVLNDLVHDLLPAAERQALLDHLRGCPACDERFRAFAAHVESARSVPPPRSRRFRRWSAVGLAAAAVVLLVVLLPGRRAGDRDLEFWIPAGRQAVALRSDASPAEVHLQRGVQAYDERRLDEAIALLRQAELEGTRRHFRDIYLASALTLRQRGSEALPLLEALPVQRLPLPWRDEAGWMRYVALVQAGRQEEARVQLEMLAARPGDIGDRARARRDRPQRDDTHE